MKVKDLFAHMFEEGITEESFNMKVPSLNLYVEFELKILKVEQNGKVIHEKKVLYSKQVSLDELKDSI